MDWNAYGDVNPLEHGGTWIREDSDCKGSFYIVKWLPLDNDVNEEGYGYHSAGYVTPTDDWINKESVYSYADLTDDSPIESKVLGLFDYYNVQEFGGEVELIHVNSLLIQLKNEGIEV